MIHAGVLRLWMSTNTDYRAIFELETCWGRDVSGENESDKASESESDGEDLDPINSEDLFETMFANPLFLSAFFVTECTQDCFADASSGAAIAHCHELVQLAADSSSDGIITPPDELWYDMVKTIVSCSYYSPWSSQFRELPAALTRLLPQFLDVAETLLPGFGQQAMPPPNFDPWAVPIQGWWAPNPSPLGRVPFLNPLFEYLIAGTFDQSDLACAICNYARIDAPTVAAYLSLWDKQTVADCFLLLDDGTKAILREAM